MECRSVNLQDQVYGFLDPDVEARLRDHLAACARCRADLARLAGEKERLASAAAPARVRDWKTLVPLAFAAALLLGLLGLLIPRPPAPVEVVAMPGAQEKGAKASKELPDDEDSLQKEIVRLDAALKNTSDE